jgi:hypothetical protein
MNNTDKRNHAAKLYVNTMIKAAENKDEDDFPGFDESSEEYKLLTDLIETDTKGFRGVVLTAITGLHLDHKFNPLDNFYACNPRSIFEQGIWYALDDNCIPCGKSDPLNVAKNAMRLDVEWANGKRPQKAATAVVKFLELIMQSGCEDKVLLIEYFFFRLVVFAKMISGCTIRNENIPSSSKQLIGSKVIEFSLMYPEHGDIPQFLVSQLLLALFDKSPEIYVVGGDDSVFGTNTTSKKPADIWCEVNGTETNLYEITVKPVTKKRLDDSLSALGSTGHLEKSVTFVCRIPDDISSLDVKDGSCLYKGKNFDFVDYKAFCSSIVALISDNDLAIVVRNMVSHIQHVNISFNTKKGWNKIFSVNGVGG